MGCLNELHKGLPSQMEKGVIKMDIQSWVEQIGANVPTNVGYVLIIRNGNDKKEDGTNPGQEAAQEIICEQLTEMTCYNVLLPEGKDPDE